MVAPEKLAVTSGLYAAQGSRLLPTAVGLMVFGRLPQLLRPEWGVAVTRVRGGSLADPLVAREDLEGTLPDLLEQAQRFVDEHSSGAAEVSLEPEYPAEAVREGLINALVHRDYRLTARTTVTLFDDRLRIWSPGGPVAQLDSETVQRTGGVSFPRNPILAATVRSLGLMEQIGRGLPAIHAAVARTTGRAALLSYSNSEFELTLPSGRAVARQAGPGN